MYSEKSKKYKSKYKYQISRQNPKNHNVSSTREHNTFNKVPIQPWQLKVRVLELNRCQCCYLFSGPVWHDEHSQNGHSQSTTTSASNYQCKSKEMQIHQSRICSSFLEEVGTLYFVDSWKRSEVEVYIFYSICSEVKSHEKKKKTSTDTSKCYLSIVT